MNPTSPPSGLASTREALGAKIQQVLPAGRVQRVLLGEDVGFDEWPEASTRATIDLAVVAELRGVGWTATEIAEVYAALPLGPGGQLSVGWLNYINTLIRLADRLRPLIEQPDEDEAAWRRFLAVWRAEFGEREVGVADLYPLADGLDLGGGPERARRTALGTLLIRHRDRIVDGHRLIFTRTRQHASLWQLRSVDSESDDDMNR
jgi:hypothetical protein